jgi:hypothetical protein
LEHTGAAHDTISPSYKIKQGKLAKIVGILK